MSKDIKIVKLAFTDEVIAELEGNLQIVAELKMLLSMKDGEGIRSWISNFKTFYPKGYELMKEELDILFEQTFQFKKDDDLLLSIEWSEEFVLKFGPELIRILVLRKDHKRLREFIDFIKSCSDKTIKRIPLKELNELADMLEEAVVAFEKQRETLN